VLASRAFAMGGPVYIDETCKTMVEARATPALKAWLKRQCPKGELSGDPACKDLAVFVRDVAGNNENWRRKCGAQQQ
jgi:hypothetical protein